MKYANGCSLVINKAIVSIGQWKLQLEKVRYYKVWAQILPRYSSEELYLYWGAAKICELCK